MNRSQQDPARLYDADLAERFIRIPEQTQEILTHLGANLSPKALDPMNLGEPFMKFTMNMLSDPVALAGKQMELARDYWSLWQNSTLRMLGFETESVIEPSQSDRRFKHPDWNDNLFFDFVKQSYLLTARWMMDRAAEAEGLEPKDAKKVRFYTKQILDAMAPTNFLFTNPEVLKATVESRGVNLMQGFRNLLNDIDFDTGRLNVSMTDKSAFEVGDTVASTPGKVVYQNDIMQILQYEPRTDTQFQVPLLIFPPWINKFYILDLKPKNSFIRWALEQGHSVFVVSWVNPDEELAARTWEDYVNEGILEAISVVNRATEHDKVHAIGYCIGGTLLASALAYMAATGDDRVGLATFFTAQVDFSEPGDLEVFIDEQQLQNLDRMMSDTGFLDASHMSTTFNMLRANDLIWTFVVNNYLMGKDPYPFDLLYWNSDSTRMPRALHMFYLREMYQKNSLVQPGGISINGVPIDLSKIEIPVYLQSAQDDHIAPYRSVFKAVQHYSGPVRFMLAGSGHIAGVINPPEAGKYWHKTNDANPRDLEEWLAGATQEPGSWWPDWQRWAEDKVGPRVPARQPGSGGLEVIEDAPGSYVKA